MGTVQNLAKLASVGKVTIQTDYENGDNTYLSLVWFKVVLEIDDTPVQHFTGYDPELDKAILTVKRMLEDHNSRMNMTRLGEILARNPVNISDKKG